MVAAFVLHPLIRPEKDITTFASSSDLADLEARKEAKYREIRDAEMDYRTGKLSEPDFRALDGELRADALAILRKIDELGRDQPSSS